MVGDDGAIERNFFPKAMVEDEERNVSGIASTGDNSQ
jgi:hypothetical protein